MTCLVSVEVCEKQNALLHTELQIQWRTGRAEHMCRLALYTDFCGASCLVKLLSLPSLPCSVARAECRISIGARSVGALPLTAMCVVFFSRVQLLLSVLMKEVLHPESQSPNGVKFHLIDVYLDELSKVGGKEVSAGCPATRGGVGPQLACTASAPLWGLVSWPWKVVYCWQ